MDFKVDQEAVLDLAAQKVADEYGDLGEIEGRVDRLVRERVETVIGKTVDERIEAVLNGALADMLDQTIQPVDVFGDKTGEATTIRATLGERAKDFWNTKVDQNGKPAERNSYGFSSARTRAEWMLGNIVSDEFMNQIRQNAASIADAFKEAMRKDAHALVDKHINALIKTVR